MAMAFMSNLYGSREEASSRYENKVELSLILKIAMSDFGKLAGGISLDADFGRAHTADMKWLAFMPCLLLALTTNAAPMGIIVPAYFYPPTY